MNDIVWETCIYKGCGYSPFPMEANYYERCRKTGETFRCPAGHQMVYNGGLTRDQKRIKELTSELSFWKETAEDYRLQRDKALRACQWIQCGFHASDRAGLHTHMRARHGMPTLAEVAEAS